jgi:uncharacterized protein
MLSNRKIDILKEYFSGEPVKIVYLFGSYARSEQSKDSDIDLLIDFNEDAIIGLIRLSRIKINIEKKLSQKVDILTRGSISPHILPFIEKDLIKIYEKSN